MRPELPVLYQRDPTTESLQERDLLYKVLFDLKRDVGELKGLLFDMLSTDTPRHQHIKEHAVLFQNIPSRIANQVQMLTQSTPSKQSP